MSLDLRDALMRKPQMAWLDSASLGIDNTSGDGMATLFTIDPEAPGEVLLFVSFQNVLVTHSGQMYLETRVDGINWVKFSEIIFTLGVLVQSIGWSTDGIASLDFANEDYTPYAKFYTDPVLGWRLGYTRVAGAAFAVPTAYNFLRAPRHG